MPHRFLCLLVLSVVISASGCAEKHQGGTSTSSVRLPEVAMATSHRTASQQAGEGDGPEMRGDQYDQIVENQFQLVAAMPLSTFSIDVDTASYAKTRMSVFEHRVLPPRDAVRIEEFINYFSYDYHPPDKDRPFAAHVEMAVCPWNGHHHLVRIGIQGKEIASDQRPATNLVFLVDVSGSMDYPNKLPLLQRGMKMLVDQLTANDRVSMVVYAGAAGCVLPSTSGDAKQEINNALANLRAGGSTNGGAGIRLAYDIARENFIAGGVNRVMLCTDGDFNVGTTSPGALISLAEQNAKTGVYLSVLGFGTGNLNDSLLEQVSNKANGNYAFVDSDYEARKVLVEQISGTLVAIAKDVKIQVEFNPAVVQAYRLIGYENRKLADRDFNDDKKDAGEIGAGHSVTALYEIVTVGIPLNVDGGSVDPLRYQNSSKLKDVAAGGEALTVKIRYKRPDEQASELISRPLKMSSREFAATSDDYKFAAAVASFGMLLRDSEFKGSANFDTVLEMASHGARRDPRGYRIEFVNLVQAAKRLSLRQASMSTTQR